MIILCFAMFFGFIAIVSRSFFFTAFVADVVYNGDVTAPEDSQEYDNYTKGVKVGSLALGISTASSLAFSFIAGPVMKSLGMRLVLVSSYVILILQSGLMIICHDLVIVFALLPALYCLFTVLLLIPYILVSEYETKSILLRKSWPYADEDLTGRACSTLMISMMSAEVLALMGNGPLKGLYGGAESVRIVSCTSSFIGAIIACFVKIPVEDSTENIEVAGKDKAVT